MQKNKIWGNKFRQVFGLAVFLLAVLFIHAKSADAATFYMANGGTRSSGESTIDDWDVLSNLYPNLATAFAQMSAGDELVIDDGVYIGDDNKINQSMQYPPDGTADQYTIIRARNEGGVLFGTESGDGDWMFLYYGSQAPGPMQYVEFRGIKWRNGGNNGNNAVNLHGSDHVKFIRCGFVDSGHETNGNAVTFGLAESSYVLVEECYAWGDGRYKFLAWHSDHIIFRRNVARYDIVYDERGPKSGFNAYGSDYVLLQNNIAIDGDTRSQWPDPDTPQVYAAFHSTSGSGEEAPNFVTFQGNIALNWDMSFSSTGGEEDAGPIEYIDNVGWALRNGNVITRAYDTSYSHNTFGAFTDPDSPDFNAYASLRSIMRNSILTDINSNVIGYGNGSSISSSDFDTVDNNSFWNLGDYDPGTNAIENVDPRNNSLLYLPRIEPGSDLSGAASDGGDVGANILKRLGRSGALWGDDGYNEIQDGTNGNPDEDLWPFPYEDQIKQDMQSYTGVNGYYINGDRGFAASTSNPRTPTGEITLTSYIWEYLGNEIPCDIYSTCDNNDTGDGSDNDSGDNNTNNSDNSSSSCFIGSIF